MNLKSVPNDPQIVDSKLAEKRIYCIASGESEGVLKLYMYAKAAGSQAVFYIELQIVRSTKVLVANIKTTNNKEGEIFKKVFESIINQQF